MSQHSADPDLGCQNRRPVPDPLAIGERPSAEATSLERRVRAHELILQSLIAHMSEKEPSFILRLKDRFTEPMKMARREHDYTGTDDYAEEFIRAIVRLGEQPPSRNSRAPEAPARNAGSGSGGGGILSDDAVRSTGAVVRKRSGIWELTVNGRFHGDYLREEHAVEAGVLAIRLAASDRPTPGS